MTTIIMGLPERFWAKTVIENTGYETPCITWTAYKLPNGYGRFGMKSEALYAHRVAYEAAKGPIPKGLVTDHLCRNRACVNADHMEAVTNRVNILRGQTVMAANAAKTHCLQGHEYTPENTIRHGGGKRRCRACVVAQGRARTERARAAAVPKPPKTHCPQGHAYDEANTYVYSDGRRRCRICGREAVRRYLDRKKERKSS